MSAFADFESTSEKVFSRARASQRTPARSSEQRTHQIIEFTKTTIVRIHSIFIKTNPYTYLSQTSVQTRDKERCDFGQCTKIASVSDKRKTLQRFSAPDSGDISDGAFYHYPQGEVSPRFSVKIIKINDPDALRRRLNPPHE